MPFVFGTLVDTFRNHKRRWLWVPAFAGTTQEFGPVIPCMTRHAPLLLPALEIIGILPAKSETPPEA